MDSTNVFGTKRPHPDSMSPPCHQTPGNKGVNGQLVYARRKVEVEHGKTSICQRLDSIGSPKSRKLGSDEQKEPKMQQNHTQQYNALPYSPGNPITGLKPNNRVVTAAPAASLDSQKQKNLNWKERIYRLQMFLTSCDQSSQDDYKQKLRSLPAAARSRHAYELERRAIHLLEEEGKELQRMQVLNVVTEAPLQDHASVFAQGPPLLAQFQQTEKTIHNA